MTPEQRNNLLTLLTEQGYIDDKNNFDAFWHSISNEFRLQLMHDSTDYKLTIPVIVT